MPNAVPTVETWTKRVLLFKMMLAQNQALQKANGIRRNSKIFCKFCLFELNLFPW